jgi:hypothetical protein
LYWQCNTKTCELTSWQVLMMTAIRNIRSVAGWHTLANILWGLYRW